MLGFVALNLILPNVVAVDMIAIVMNRLAAIAIVL
jgi:hypothetical protein